MTEPTLQDPIACSVEQALPTVTVDDHEAGKKEVTVRFRSGRTETWTVQAVPARQARKALVTLLQGEENPILEMAVAGHVGDIDKLALDSLADVERVAMALAFGESEYQRMAEAAAGLARLMFAASKAPAHEPTTAQSTEPTASPKSEN